jgi:hypothetical protein
MTLAGKEKGRRVEIPSEKRQMVKIMAISPMIFKGTPHYKRYKVLFGYFFFQEKVASSF